MPGPHSKLPALFVRDVAYYSLFLLCPFIPGHNFHLCSQITQFVCGPPPLAAILSPHHTISHLFPPFAFLFFFPPKLVHRSCLPSLTHGWLKKGFVDSAYLVPPVPSFVSAFFFPDTASPPKFPQTSKSWWPPRSFFLFIVVFFSLS